MPQKKTNPAQPGRIQQGWETIAGRAAASGRKPKNAREARAAFYAGAAVMHNIFMDACKASEGEFTAIMDDVQREMKQFIMGSKGGREHGKKEA